VNLKNASQNKIECNFELTVNAEETVQSVKERIAASQLIAFPDQDLLLNGKVLEEMKTLADYDVKDRSALDFVVKATEESLVQQLAELLQARDLTSDELGLLYCYKHGVSINQAMKTVGYKEKFPEFLRNQKQFVVENARVSLIRSDTKKKPFPAGEEIKKKEAQPRAPQQQRGEQQKATREAQPRAPQQQRSEPKTIQAKPPVVSEPSAALVVDSEPSDALVLESSDSQEYMELHNTISGRSFNSKVAQTLNDIVEIVTEKLFLNVAQVVKGGSVGKGTAITGTTDAQVVFFLKGLPKEQQSKWLPPLLKAVAGVLTEHLSNGHGVEDICTTDHSVHMKVKSCVEVDLQFSPDFESYTEVIQAMGQQLPDKRKHLDTALVKERVQFVSKQPGQVKVTMRLLKWWRDQQRWSSSLTTPSDDVLELIAVYSALQTKPGDQRMAVANAMSLLARFQELRIVWSNYYQKEEIWSPLLQQRPLLMDPVNPFLNVADPKTFDASELMATARNTHFFW